jgi:hypothetical protein
MGTMRNAYKILIGKPEWKRPLGILTDRRTGRPAGRMWTVERVQWWAVVNTVMNLRIL